MLSLWLLQHWWSILAIASCYLLMFDRLDVLSRLDCLLSREVFGGGGRSENGDNMGHNMGHSEIWFVVWRRIGSFTCFNERKRGTHICF